MFSQDATRGQPPLAVGQLSQIVFDSSDPERLASFWGALLGVEVAERTADWIALGALPGGLTLGFQPVPEPKAVKNRVHLDLNVAEIEAASRSVEALGGRRVADIEGWRVMADPEGNEFCLLKEGAAADQVGG